MVYMLVIDHYISNKTFITDIFNRFNINKSKLSKEINGLYGKP